MTTTEFSQEFDILYNNIKSQSAPGLDEYEKSVFLTKAQEELVKNYFNPTSNKLQQGFDGSEKRQVDFAELIKSTDIVASVPTPGTYESIDPRAQVFLLPADVFIVTNEQVTLTDSVESTTYQAVVKPIDYREFDRVMMKPYRNPVKRQCWRLMQSNVSAVAPNGQSIVSEIISKTNTTVTSYRIRYVKKPQPIILESIAADGLSINGVSAKTECELNPIIHREILDRAVELAKVSYEAGDPASLIQVNTRNE
jgi:hypothetical protein